MMASLESIPAQVVDLLLILAPFCHSVLLWVKGANLTDTFPYHSARHQQQDGGTEETWCPCGWEKQCLERQAASSGASSSPNTKNKHFSTLRIHWFAFFFPSLPACLLGKTNSTSHPKDCGDTKKALLYQLLPPQTMPFNAWEFTSSHFGKKIAMDALNVGMTH